MAMSESQWLHLPATGGHFECPADAVPAWKARGWQECEQPEIPNPAMAEWVPYAQPVAVADEPPALPEAKTKSDTKKDVTDRG